MSKDTTSIQLPPRKPAQAAARPAGALVIWAFAGLCAGLAIGLLAGNHAGLKAAGGEISTLQERVEALESRSAPGAVAEVRSALQQAGLAAAQGDMAAAREGYEKVKALDPGNAAADAALSLIDWHDDKSRGGLRVRTAPEGALVKLGNRATAVSPAEFDDVPFGTYTMEVSLEGYQPYVQKIRIAESGVLELEPIQLAKNAGRLELSSEPPGVEFKLLKTDEVKKVESLVEIGTTPATIEKLDEGDYQVLLALDGWDDYRENITVEPNRNASVSHVFARGGLQVTSDPSEVEVWLKTDAKLPARKLGLTPLSVDDLPVGKHQIVARYRDWEPISRTVEVHPGAEDDIVFTWKRGPVLFRSDPAGAKIFFKDKRVGNGDEVTPFAAEFPEGEYAFVAQYGDLEPVSQVLSVKPDADNPVMFEFDYGSVSIESEPEGASVLMNGQPLGRTPFRQEVVRPGPYSYTLTKPQFRGNTVSGDVKPGQSLNVSARLIFDPSPKTRKDFVNGQGLSMVWVDSLSGWVGAHEVDQRAFESLMHKNPSEFKGPDLPVQGVSWYEASTFCETLTLTERNSGLLPRGYRYQLPSDEQWSLLVGDAKIADGVTSKGAKREGPGRIGSSEPNEYGLYDMRGNLWEWCEDWYSLSIVNRARTAGLSTNPVWVGTERKVLRGGAWNRSSDSDLNVEYRLGAFPSTAERYDIGFRVVLVPE